jgi:hypothetical protein
MSAKMGRDPMEKTFRNFLLDDPFPEEYFVVIFFLRGIDLVEVWRCKTAWLRVRHH